MSDLTLRAWTGMRRALAAALILLLGGCGGWDEPRVDCSDPYRATSDPVCVSRAIPPGPSTLIATPQRFPVVALSDNRDAIVLANGRQGDDRSNPVHKFARTYRLEGGVFGAAADLAGITANTFIAAATPDQSGSGRDSLVSDASGSGVAVWTAGNAGVLEMYVNYYLAGFSARELIARPAANVLDHRVAMDGTGNLAIVWRSADGLMRARDRLGSAALGPEVVLPTGTAHSSLGDVAFTGLQANVVWGGASLEVFASRGIGTTWESPERIGTGLNGVPARLASHPSAPGFALVAVWQDADSIVFNSRTTAAWQSSTGSRIPGSEAGSNPQVTMSAGGEVMVVWESPAGIRASRRGSGAFSAAEIIGSGNSPRVASDAAGNAVTVWVSGKTIRANRYVVGSGWLGQQDIGGDRVGESRANVAMDQNGRAVVVWEREVTATSDPLDTEVAAYAFFAPTARFTMTPNPAATGATVTFDATASGGNGAALANYQWDFDNDGTFDATGVNVTTSFATAGARSVRLRVTDAAGLRNDTTQTLTVAGATRSLNLTVAGAGGRVTGTRGLDCRAGGVGICMQTYLLGTSVSLQALPDAGWQFTAWSGDCAGTAATIAVMLDVNRLCTATFSLIGTPTLTVSVIGNGTVTSTPAGIACAPDCTESYPPNTVVTLTATPAAGFNFSTWGGDCTGAATTVVVTLSTNRSCTATFTTPPPPPTSLGQRFSANNGSSYAVTASGAPYSWGSDGSGTLGNGGADTNVNVATPMGTLTDVRGIGSGQSFGVAAKADGTVWVWGYAGSTFCFSTGSTDPVPVRVAGATSAVAVSGGGSHTLILRNNGTVQAFGCNYGGQLGRSGTTPSATAVDVAGLNDITAVAAGDAYSFALKSDGTVWAWGMGPLADGTTGPATRFTPMAIAGLTNVIAIAAGGQHALALKSDGSVWAWGSNTNGKLGDGTEVARWMPTATLLTSQITAISAGAEHSLALRSDGVVLSWGINETGQLGSGSSSPGYRPAPAPVVSLTGVVAIAAGSFGLGHSLAVRSDGTVWGWGYNMSGQLGNGMVTSSNTPVQVTGLNLN